MSTTKWSNVIAAMAVLASIVTTLVSSHYVVLSLEMQAAKERQMLEAANAKSFLDQFSEKTEPVSVAFNDLLLYAGKKDFNFKTFSDKADLLSSKAAALMPYVDSSMYFDIDDVAVAASNFSKESDISKYPDRIETLKVAMKKFMSNYFAYRDQLIRKVPVPKERASAEEKL